MRNFEKCRASLERYNIDMTKPGGMALLSCTYVFCERKSRKIANILEWYAAFTGKNVWNLHKQMSLACARAECGYSPGKLMRQVAKEVDKGEN